jgi:glucosyl-dolichyl phosphate glucuronosyltransferase
LQPPRVETMELSIIVCTFNRCRLLEGNLTALSRQQVAPGIDWEVLVIDNNCTDDTAKVVTGMAARFPAPLRRIEEAKQGLSNARNRGIAEARGRYLLFTDDDTRPEPEWAQAVRDTFQSSSCAAVGGKVELLWPDERPHWLADELLSTLAGVDYGECEIDLSLEQPPLGANMAFRREVFEKIGGFNPELGRIGAKLLGGEETDLFKRLAESGCSGKYQPKAVVNHVLEPERLRKAYFRKVYFHGGQSRGLLFSPGPGRRFIGVPLFSVRQLLQKGLAYLSAAISDEPSESFVKELHAWWLLGFMAGCSQNRQRPHA